MLYKGFVPEEGDDVQFVGVHALAWRVEWGEPKMAFVSVEDEMEAKYTDLLRRVREAVGVIANEQSYKNISPEWEAGYRQGLRFAESVIEGRVKELEDK